MRYTHRFFIFFLFFCICVITKVRAEDLLINNSNQVLHRVLKNNSTLKAQKIRIQGSKALIDQANSIPNPMLNLESEDFGGSLNGFKEAENTFSLSQKIELGGKRGARATLATSQVSLLETTAKLRLANLLRDVRTAYANVVLSQKILNLIKEQEQFTRKILQTITNRVAHGGVLSSEQTKAEIALRAVGIEKKKAQNTLAQNKRLLALFWNGSASEIGELAPNASDNQKVIDLTLIVIEDTLALKNSSSQISVSKNLALNESAQSVPDITVTGGYRRFEATNDDAFVASISIPLQLSNRNQGRVSQAQKVITANKAEYTRAKNSIKVELENLVQTRDVLQLERVTIEKHLLPDSKQTLAQVRKAYQLGRVGYLDLINSQDIYFGVKKQKAQNHFELQRNEAQISAITGQILKSIEGAH